MLEKASETSVVFYIRSSTTGLRGVDIAVTYTIKDGETEHKCGITKKLNLDTVEPFLISSELLRYEKIHLTLPYQIIVDI